MSDAYLQREDERAWEEVFYERWMAEERRDRALEKGPIDECDDCGELPVEVRSSEWECGC